MEEVNAIKFSPISEGKAGKGVGVALDTERANASFNTDKMTNIIWSPQYIKRQGEIRAMLENDPVFYKWDMHYQDRLKRHHRALEKMMHLWNEYHLKGKIDFMDPLDSTLCLESFDDMMPLGLHFSAFIPPVMAQGTEEQKAKWIPLAKSLKVIATYGQTEIAHGSFLRGLETKAVYDRATQTFKISTGKVGMKYWPGGLARTCNHALTMAQLIIDGKSYGPHTFIVPLRDMDTHKELPGVKLMDIGPKYGFTSMDNGMCLLENVVIPRDSMLMRFFEVTPDGQYIKKGNEKLSYGSMVSLRNWVVDVAARTLARGCTVSIRYSAVRRQFPPLDIKGRELPNAMEVPVLDYQNQQYALLPLLASSYAMQFVGKWMGQFYNEFEAQLAKGQTGLLSEIHAATAGLKALTSGITAEGLEVCRKSCGGHGYNVYSGLIHVIADYIPAQTYEGENSLMFLQTARFLVKSLVKLTKGGSMPPTLAYLQRVVPAIMAGAASQAHTSIQHSHDWLYLPNIVAAYEHRAASLLLSVSNSMRTYQKTQNVSPMHSWQNHLVDLIRAGRAHSMVLIVQQFAAAVDKATGAEKEALGKLCSLFGLFYMEKEMADFLQDGYITSKQAGWVREEIRKLLPVIRKDAVALVDAWNFSDFYLASALGRYDGNYIDALIGWAKIDPVNNMSVPTPEQEKFLLPVIRAKM